MDENFVFDLLTNTKELHLYYSFRFIQFHSYCAVHKRNWILIFVFRFAFDWTRRNILLIRCYSRNSCLDASIWMIMSPGWISEAPFSNEPHSFREKLNRFGTFEIYIHLQSSNFYNHHDISIEMSHVAIHNRVIRNKFMYCKLSWNRGNIPNTSFLCPYL